MTKLLWVSDNPMLNFVGQSIVTRRCLDQLRHHYDVSVFGYSEVDDKRLMIDESLSYPVYIGKRYDEQGMMRIIERINPDILVLSHDAFLYGCLPEIRGKFPKLKIVGWFTVDGHPIPSAYRNIFLSCDAVVSPTVYGKNVIQRQFVDIPVFVVPYGIDHELHKPNNDKAAMLKELIEAKFRFNQNFEEKVQKNDVFVGVFWGHNQSKKNLSAIFESWVKADLPPESHHLLVVTHSVQANRGSLKYLGDYDYGNYVMSYSDRIQVVEGTFLDKHMANLIRFGDALLFPSIGEGFGLPLVEAMACGLVPITSNYAGATDFCVNGYNSLLLGGEFLTGELGVKRMAVSVNQLTERIKWAFEAWKNKENFYGIPEVANADDIERPDITTPKEVNCWNTLIKNAQRTAKTYNWSDTVTELHRVFRIITSESFTRGYVHTQV